MPRHYSNGLSPYGRFDHRTREFVLTRTPPRKWTNVHTSDPAPDEVYAEITNIGDGPIWVRDDAGCTCNIVGYDSKFFYIRDDETNRAFNPGGEPLATLVRTTTRFHAGRTITTGTALGLRATQRTFVPHGETFQSTTLTVENRSRKTRRVSVFAYAMFQLTGTNAEGGFVWKDNSSEILPALGGVFVRNRERAVPNGRFNGYLITLQRDLYAGASGYRDFFTRSDFGLGTPRLLWGWNADNRAYRGPDSAGCVQLSFELAPGETRRADFLIGQAADTAEIAALLTRTTPASLDAALDAVLAIEERRAAAFTIDTGHPDRDAIINHFAKKAMTSYLINKSGFRDNLQNDMGVALYDWPVARANLLRAISSQYEDGSFPHGFRPYNRHHYADKPCWILHCVPWCLKESGDLAFLNELVGYERSELRETVWQHMLRALRFLARDLGANGLCDQHHADWNDGLEPSEKTGARESVMVTQQLCLGLLEVGELARRRGDTAVETETRDLFETFKRRLNDVAWDGDWFVRTITASGYRLGSHVHDEGKIFLETQAWAVLSQTAEGDRGTRALDAVERHLETDYGISIAAPAYTKFDERVGRFSASRPYFAENGGCYNHAAGFKAVADCILGRAESAWRTWLKVVPGSPWNSFANSAAEPTSFTNCYSLTPEAPGMSMYAWRTGTTAWFTQLILEWILGARRHYDGLLIDPCLPAELTRVKLTRTFRGAVYQITIDNRAGRGRGVTRLRLDGRAITGNVLPPPVPGATHRVDVVI